jgi:phospholipase A1
MIRAFFFSIFFVTLPALAYVDEGSPPLVLFSPYKPTYFLVGKHEGKVQFSLKARPAEAIPLYAGYTQLMMWDIFKSSAPMRDINFNPELFYRLLLGDEKELRWLDFGIFEHESNGLNGNGSRSWNRSYLRFSDALSFEGVASRLQWSFKIWVPYSCEDKQCGQYRGIYEGTISLENIFGSEIGENDIALRFYGGGRSYIDPVKGGQELTFRIRPSKKAYFPLFAVQLFQGYGENMLDQDRKGLALRGGIGF